MKSMMDIEKTIRSKDMLNMYLKEESLLFDNMIKSLNRINIIINISASNNIESLNNEIIKKARTISNIHMSDVTVLDKNIENYNKASHDAKEILGDII